MITGYGDTRIAEAGNLDVWRGDRIALIGPNGSGKTTLLRTIAGELPPVSRHAEGRLGRQRGALLAGGRGPRQQGHRPGRDPALPRHAEPGGAQPVGPLPVQRRRRAQAGERPQRRRTLPSCPRQARPGAGQPPAAGRADQPPRHPFARVAGSSAGVLRRHADLRLARPAPDRLNRDASLGDRPRAASPSSKAPTRSTSKRRPPKPPRRSWP